MKKKKKKVSPPSTINRDRSFEPDNLVDGDSPKFDQLRVFTCKNDSVVYSFREHFLYFPWENIKSHQYSTSCPPASFHLEKRSDLKSFNFFEFRKNKAKVNLYRFSRERKLCDDLLEYISDNVEDVARNIFQQQLEELRTSKILVKPIQEPKPIAPPFQHDHVTETNFVRICHKKSMSEVKPSTTFKEFEEWYNSLKNDLVSEVQQDKDYISIQFVDNVRNPVEFLDDKDHMIDFNSSNDHILVRSFISGLIKQYFNSRGTKFKIALAGPSAFGKTYLRDLFCTYNVTDLDDISMFDPIIGPQLHKLVNARRWNEMSKLYEQVINAKFKEGVLLVQNQGQVPLNIPVISVITPGFINSKKEWSDRSLFDTVNKSRYKIYLRTNELRNSLVQILLEEIYNSSNFK